MLFYCCKCRKNTEKKPKTSKTKNGKMIISSNCVVSGSKKLIFIKEPETRY